jgi:hypothetical protein
VCPALNAHGKDRNQIKKICAVKFTARFKILYICEGIFAAVGKLKIEHFAVRDCKAHSKMLSVRPRRRTWDQAASLPWVFVCREF